MPLLKPRETVFQWMRLRSKFHMAIVNIIGYGIFNLDKIISDPPRSKNARITSISPFEVNVDIELDINDNGVYIPTSIRHLTCLSQHSTAKSAGQLHECS